MSSGGHLLIDTPRQRFGAAFVQIIYQIRGIQDIDRTTAIEITIIHIRWRRPGLVEEINQEGVLGGKIEFTTRDTKFKVDIALNMAKELVLRENVDVMVGIINSGAGLAVSEAVAKRKRSR